MFLQHAASNCQEQGDASNPNSQQNRNALELSPANKQTHPLRNNALPANQTQRN